MSKVIRVFKNIFFPGGYIWRFYQREISTWLEKHIPIKIPVKQPMITLFCPRCGRKMELTGHLEPIDGWYFYYSCPIEIHEDSNIYVNWYPFLFGAWANEKDISRLGIKVE